MIRLGACFFFLFMLGVATSQSQTRLMSTIKVTNTATQQSQVLAPNTSATENQGFAFPSSPGTAGQVVSIGSVSDGTSISAWYTPAGSYSSLTSYLSTAVEDAGSVASGAGVAVAANKSYRITGEFDVYRIAGGGGGGSDEVIFGIYGWPTSATGGYVLECTNCVSPTTVPVYRNSADNLASCGTLGDCIKTPAIDPNSTADLVGAANSYHYRLEGVINVSTTAGTIKLGFNKSTGGNNAWLAAGSYFVITPLPQ